MASNGDTDHEFEIDGKTVVGIGSFHKTLPHDDYGEVDKKAFKQLVKATRNHAKFGSVPPGPFKAPATRTAPFVNPQAGLAKDRLTNPPSTYDMPPAPGVLSKTTAAEITELYWMALLRDISFDTFETEPKIKQAADEINQRFGEVVGDQGNPARLQTGIDVPGKAGKLDPITPGNVFRMGLPGEEAGPLVSQFFVRRINLGTQTIDQQQRPYKAGKNYLTEYESWLNAQNSGNGDDGRAYSQANEDKPEYYEADARYISTMRDLARFVNKDALHQAYFNACLLMLSGGARWTPGNPYGKSDELEKREAGFGTLGGPHILALVSEVATRALKVVWYQKWQVHLRLRPEAYAGLVHVQNLGVGKVKRPYGLPDWVGETEAAKAVRVMSKKSNPSKEETLFLPMAYTSGSPAHPAYGAGHATVAGICVTVLKAFFKTIDDQGKPIPLTCMTEPVPGCLMERPNPYLPATPFKTYVTGVDAGGKGIRKEIPATGMTIEGELNKLAMNVAMGRSMGGVHWRTDNTRSFMLGEAVAARILADVTEDLAEKAKFEFRTFSRKKDGNPKTVVIQNGKVRVDGKLVSRDSNSL